MIQRKKKVSESALRPEEISADILAIDKEAEGLLDGLLKTGTAR